MFVRGAFTRWVVVKSDSKPCTWDEKLNSPGVSELGQSMTVGCHNDNSQQRVTFGIPELNSPNFPLSGSTLLIFR